MHLREEPFKDTQVMKEIFFVIAFTSGQRNRTSAVWREAQMLTLYYKDISERGSSLQSVQRTDARTQKLLFRKNLKKVTRVKCSIGERP